MIDRFRNRFKTIFVYALLILFLGYYGGITLFPHHHIVDGISVVHSHPYRSGPGSVPSDHQHSKNGFVLIQFLSAFIAISPLVFYGVTIIRRIVNNLFLITDENVAVSFSRYCTYLPRAPSLNLHN